MTSDLTSHVFFLTLRGLAVFPLAEGAKVPPKGTHGHLDATKELDTIRSWWTKHPRRNIGIATGAKSRVWILDVDPKNGGDKSLLELTREHGELPPTVSVETPSDGTHMWWRWPIDGRVIRNSAGRIGPGLDVRGEGGYVVVPPSSLGDECCYSWIRGPVEILDAPDWLIDLALPPVPENPPVPKPLSGDIDRYCAAAIADELRRLGQAGEGTRNDTLNKAAFAIGGFVLAGAVPEDWARVVLESRAVSIGLSARESRRTIASAFSAAQPREAPS